MTTLNVIWATVSEIFGDFGFKEFARQGTAKGFLQGALGYVGVIFFLIQSLKGGNILYVNDSSNILLCSRSSLSTSHLSSLRLAAV